MKVIMNSLFKKYTHELLFFVGFILLLLTYYISMPKTVVLEDDGLFILSAFFNGVSHPPGYPLHSLISHFATLFPSSNVAVKVHMVSAFFGALASLLAGVFVYHLYKNILLSLMTLFIVGVGQGFWSQSIISEVYTLNAFLVMLLLILILNLKNILSADSSLFVKNKLINKYVFLIFLCIGLGLSNHWPLFLLGGAGCLIIIPYVIPYKCFLRRFGIGFIGLSLGLLPYVWLVVNSNNDPFISFVGPINDFSEFYDFVSRKIYRDRIDIQVVTNVADKVNYIGFSLFKSLTEHYYYGAILVIFGIIVSFNNNFNYKLLVICFFVTPLLLPVLLDFNYTEWYKVVFE